VKLKGIEMKTDQRRCPLCLGEEDEKHILLKCLENSNWRMEL
jgi:hypothetical protein